MKNKLLKLLNIILLVIILFPFSKVSAETWKHEQLSLNLNFLPDVPDVGSYHINGDKYLHINKTTVNGSTYTAFWLHQLNNGANYYHGYCLNVGLPVDNTTVTMHKGFEDLKSNFTKEVFSSQQRQLLENIVASGYQNGSGQVIGTIMDGFHNCIDKIACSEIIATQILIWEVTDYARTSYKAIPEVNTDSSPYNMIVNAPGNVTLKEKYNEILKKAESLTGSIDTIPSGLRKSPITLIWNDNNQRYEYKELNIGEYDYYSLGFTGSLSSSNKFFDKTESKKSNSSNLEVSQYADEEGETHYVDIYADSYIENSYEIFFKLTKGEMSSGSLDFRWFEFPEKGRQNVLLGDYTKTYERSIKVITEEGKINFTKIDSNTLRPLKGAIFELRKCNANQTVCNSDVQEIDLTTTTNKEITLRKSGWYLLVETKTPEGYEKLKDILVQVEIENGRAKIINFNDTEGKIKREEDDDSKVVLLNDSKEFYIQKIEGKTNKAIKGATFQIKDSNGNLLKFTKTNDVYRYSKDGTITDIVDPNYNTYQITLLPAGEYTIVETNVPYPYTLPKNQIDREIKIKVDKEYNVSQYNKDSKKYVPTTNATIIVENYKTKVVLLKYGNKGKPLPGVIFELYDSKKQNQITIKSLGNGNYEYDKSQTTPIQLITNNDGNIIVHYLPEGTYYFKEIQTVEGYEIDKDLEWTEVEVSVTDGNDGISELEPITNAKGEFCFYKIDEDGNYLNGGLFKLQVYNEKIAKFEDVALEYLEKDKMFTIDTTGKSDIYTFETISNGQTCFKEMNAKGRYRVVEIDAPEGFILPKVSEMDAEIVINENGYAIGSAVIINKKITVGEGAEAQAELIVNISTGQERIHYTIIIGILLVIITGLFIIRKKIDKK